MKQLVAALLGAAIVAAGCSAPHHRGDSEVSKIAASDQEIDRVFDRYRAVRNAAIDLLDAKPLSIVEGGSVLQIDSGSFVVALAQSRARNSIGPIDVRSVATPRFTQYPLWFYAVARDREARVDRVQIFQRTSPVDPWLLVASPEVVMGAELPPLRTTDSGAVASVKPHDGHAMALSPQQAADAYAATVVMAGTTVAREVGEDAFMRQMRRTAATNAGLKDVTFSQTWRALPVKFALRTDDGGALVFVDLMRVDTYEVKGNQRVTFPKGTPQQALLSDGIWSKGSLTYIHQVLVRIPAGDDVIRALGQWGGPISVSGQ